MNKLCQVPAFKLGVKTVKTQLHTTPIEQCVLLYAIFCKKAQNKSILKLNPRKCRNIYRQIILTIQFIIFPKLVLRVPFLPKNV